TGYVASYFDSVVNFNPSTTILGTNRANGPSTFSVRWTGLVKADETGSYTFTTVSDDGVRLSVNSALLVDNWTTHGTTENSGSINLVAGSWYPLTLEYFNNGGGGVIQLYYTEPGEEREIIPASNLGH